MGDDDFTRGKPHPMIDPTLRNQRLLNELNDSHCRRVIRLVLGYGASTTPASELLDQLSHIDMNNAPLLIAHVCGTEADPQIRSHQQIRALQNAGVIIASSNAQAALWASTVAQTQLQKRAKRMNTLFNQPLKVVNAGLHSLLTIFNMPGKRNCTQLAATSTRRY